MADQIEVTNNRDAGRFEVKLGDEVAFAEYRLTGEGIVFPHTVVPEAFEGRGVGSALVREGMKFAKEEGRLVTPTCSFFAGYLAKHPEYNDQLEPGYRA
jgi:predicted GNAT family acetyltransferase